MKFEVKNRWSGEVQFTAEIEADETTDYRVKIGLAVKWALEARADLTRADLTGADLARANLTDFKNDFWAILLQNKPEVPGLMAALKEGHIDGSTYSGECACLVGTIANVRGVNVNDLERNSSRPAEQWFLMIRKGDKPGDATGGGFASQRALEWAEEFCGYAGIQVVATPSGDA